MSYNLAKLDILLVHAMLAEDTGHKLIVQTAVGQYIGKIYNPEDESHEYISVISKHLNGLRHSKYDEDNPTAIFMVDVELRTSSIGGTTRMPYVCLFLDQILGVSIGRLEQSIKD